MTEDIFPSVRILAKDAQTIEVKLPSGDGTTFLTLPEKLHGQELPSFVLEWLIDADEVGLMVQELLQAPARSLCGVAPAVACWSSRKRGGMAKRPFFRRRTNRPYPRLPDVRPFKESVEEPTKILGLPEGVQLPADLLDTIEMANRVDTWLETGRRVREWLEEQG